MKPSCAATVGIVATTLTRMAIVVFILIEVGGSMKKDGRKGLLFLLLPLLPMLG